MNVVPAVLVVLVLIVFVRLAVRKAVSTAVGETIGPYAETHAWVGVAVAFALVVWAVLEAAGVIHEPPSWKVRAYIFGAVGAIALIQMGFGAITKRR